ncbi:hypothetical protein YC2023_094180 [Brassica napus]
MRNNRKSVVFGGTSFLFRVTFSDAVVLFVNSMYSETLRHASVVVLSAGGLHRGCLGFHKKAEFDLIRIDFEGCVQCLTSMCRHRFNSFCGGSDRVGYSLEVTGVSVREPPPRVVSFLKLHRPRISRMVMEEPVI